MPAFCCMWKYGEHISIPHSSTLAWKIPWAEEPGRLQSMGSWRDGHDWATSLWLFTFMHWRRKWQPTPVFLPGESQGTRAWWTAIYGVVSSVRHNWSDLAAAAAAAAWLEWKDLVRFSIHHRHYQWFATCPYQYLQGDSGFQQLHHQTVAKETREGKKNPQWHSISRQSRHPWKQFQQSYEGSWNRLLIINSKPSSLTPDNTVCLDLSFSVILFTKAYE